MTITDRERSSFSSAEDPPISRQEPFAPLEPFQVLSEDGLLTKEGQARDIDQDLVRQMHIDMVLARRLDEEALALQRQGELHLWLMSSGQEASQVGSIRALESCDMVFPTYREHAAALCRGISPADIFRQWRGVAHSGWNPHASNFHINSLVLGTQTLHATGYAAGVRLDRADEVVMTYFGDGSASQGDVNEALNWAAVRKAPVIFFCQNNQWAISTPSEAQSRSPLHVRAAGFGVPGYHVDGNDVLAVHAITRHAASYVRSGAGPVLIEAQTYRLGGHSSSDDPKRYRDEIELEAWKTKDPISRIEAYLRSGDTPDSYFSDVQARAEAFAEQVRAECKSLHDEGLEESFMHTYAEHHPVMQTELSDYTARKAALESA